MYSVQALPGLGQDASEAYSVNSGGAVAGVSDTSFFTGMIWSGGSFFSMPVGSSSILHSINDSNDAVGVQKADNSLAQTAVLVRGGAIQDLSNRVGVSSIANGINNSGLVCGWSWNDPRSFVLDANSAAAATPIDPLPGTARSLALAINQIGSVVGLCDDHGFLYAGGNLVDLGQAAFIEGINVFGQICGSIGKAVPQNFSPGLWVLSGGSPVFTEIPVPQGFVGGHADGINDDGVIVGTCWTAETFNGQQSAFIYRTGVSTDLNTLLPYNSGWHLEFAQAINDRGQIAGIGVLNGRRTAYLLTPTGCACAPFGASLGELVAILLLGGFREAGAVAPAPAAHRPDPLSPWAPNWFRLPAVKRDVLMGLALHELASQLEDPKARQAVSRAALEGVESRIRQLIETLHEPPAPTWAPPEHAGIRQGKLSTRLRRLNARHRAE